LQAAVGGWPIRGAHHTCSEDAMADPTPMGSGRDRCGAVTARPLVAVGGTSRMCIRALDEEPKAH
jgi:hypothetical protein